MVRPTSSKLIILLNLRVDALDGIKYNLKYVWGVSVWADLSLATCTRRKKAADED
jgi:hypothetical protein